MIQPSRIDRERLDAVDFPIRVDVPIRFNDLDVLGHVNNTAAAVILVAIGRTSFTMAQVGRQNGRSALYAEVTLVVSGANGSVPIPDDFLAAIERLRVATR